MRRAGPRAVAIRHIALAVVVSALCAYGYGQEQDPFIGAWKLVASQANQGRWAEARSAVPGLDPGLAEIDDAFAWKLAPPIAAALEARDARALARDLTVAACGAILWKLEASRRADLRDYYAAKYRVEAARTFYAELLAPAVRHQDATRRARTDERIIAALARIAGRHRPAGIPRPRGCAAGRAGLRRSRARDRGRAARGLPVRTGGEEMSKWVVAGLLPLALALASGSALAQSEVEALRTRVRELEQQQQRTDAELDELRALLVGEGGATRAPAAPSPAPVTDEDIDLGVLAGASEGSILSRMDFHGHLAVDYVGIAKPSAGSVEPSRDPDAELLPRSSFTASDLTFFVGLPIYEDVYAATEIEYESGGDEITLDQAFVQWDLASEERLSLRGGKFYFPFGIDRYYQNAPTNPLVDRPAPFLFVIPETYSETGIELLGELPLGDSPELVGEYELALVNGLGQPAFASMREARQNRDNNSGKAYGGRLGLVWDRWLRLGVSGLTGNYDTSNDDGMWAAGADLRADWGTVALRSEWTIARVENPDAVSAEGIACPDLPCPELEPLTPLGGSFSRQGWYVEGVWRPRPVFAQFLGPLEYVLRYDVLDDDQHLQDVLDGQRFAAGIVFHPREHFRLKAEYEIVDDESSEVDNNGFLFQGAVDW